MTPIPSPKTQFQSISDPIRGLASRDSWRLSSVKAIGCADAVCFSEVAEKTQFRPNSATESDYPQYRKRLIEAASQQRTFSDPSDRGIVQTLGGFR